MSTIPFSKPCLSFDAQYNKLTSSILDNNHALAELLMHSSYYRIKNYLPPLQTIYQNDLIPIQEVKTLIDFDSTLRSLIFRCIEPIEIYFRSTISEYMLEASHGDSFWYLDTQYFVDIEKHSKALEIIKKDFFQSNESFIKTYQQKYTLPILTKSHNTIYNLPPTWMFNEISSFGLFSSIFRNLNKKHQKNIAKVFLLDEVILSSWILSLLTVRNTCAHHARLWNKRLGTAPKNPNKNPFSIQCNNRKIAIILQILIRLLTVIHGPDNPYASQLKAIAINTSPFIQFGMGFTQPLTKNSFQ